MRFSQFPFSDLSISNPCVVQIQGEPFEPLAPAASGLRIESASLLESSPVLKSRSSTLTIVGNKFYPEVRQAMLPPYDDSKLIVC